MALTYLQLLVVSCGQVKFVGIRGSSYRGEPPLMTFSLRTEGVLNKATSGTRMLFVCFLCSFSVFQSILEKIGGSSAGALHIQ